MYITLIVMAQRIFSLGHHDHNVPSTTGTVYDSRFAREISDLREG
jgi:hypothetical protein